MNHTSAPNAGLQPIVLTGSAGNRRMQSLAEAARHARGEAVPNYPPLTAARQTSRRVIPLSLMTVLALVVAVFGPGLWRSASVAMMSDSGLPRDFHAPLAETAPALPSGQIAPPAATGDYSAIMVNPTASATLPLLIEYFDYQCPACRNADAVFGARISDLAARGVIRLQLRAMTFLDSNLSNDSSTRAAVAAACADTVGAYSTYHRVIYANQPRKEGTGFTDPQLRTDFATQAGITGAKLATFQKCYDARATTTFVASVDQKAKDSGVRSTPTFVFNGKSLAGQLDLNDPASLDRALGTSGR